MNKINNNSVLIVDDIPENLQILGNILIAKGLDVGFAIDGFQALETVAINKPDLILLDVMMPGMNGFTVCEKLKADPATKDIPVIFLTAKTQSEDIIKGFEVGGVDFVTKPFNSGELLARVTTQLELKNARDVINKQNEELADLNSQKDKFFSIIAHDLRGPFSGALGLSDLIIHEHVDMTKNEIVDLNIKIHNTLKNQYNLLENLLQWARIQMKRFEFQPVKTNLKLILNDSIIALKQTAENKKIEIVNELPDNLYVDADRLMLRLIFHNLLSNAIKFSFEGDNIYAKAEFDEDTVTISIIDSGLGITEDAMAKLFKIDSHHSTLGTKKEKGTGLGLILCKEMVNCHGGNIWPTNNADAGATISFTLEVYKYKPDSPYNFSL